MPFCAYVRICAIVDIELCLHGCISIKIIGMMFLPLLFHLEVPWTWILLAYLSLPCLILFSWLYKCACTSWNSCDIIQFLFLHMWRLWFDVHTEQLMVFSCYNYWLLHFWSILHFVVWLPYRWVFSPLPPNLLSPSLDSMNNVSLPVLIVKSSSLLMSLHHRRNWGPCFTSWNTGSFYMVDLINLTCGYQYYTSSTS